MHWHSLPVPYGFPFLLLGYFFYFRHVLKKDLKTNGVTWTLSALNVVVALGAAWASGYHSPYIYQLLLDAIGCLLITILCFRRRLLAVPEPWEIGVGAVALIALLCWGIFKNSALGYALCNGALFISNLPILITSWNRRTRDPVDAWVIWGVATILICWQTIAQGAHPLEIVFTISSTFLHLAVAAGLVVNWFKERSAPLSAEQSG